MKVHRLELYTGLVVLSALMLTSFINAKAQLPEVKEVKGNYVNEDLGIELVLPENWSGMELPIAIEPAIGGLMASPEDASSNEVAMSLIIIDATKFDPSTQPTSPQPEDVEFKCTTLSLNTIEISEIKGMEIVVECEDIPTSYKIKSVFLSQEKDDNIRFIQLALIASSELYDIYIKDFDDSVKTLKVSNAIPPTINLSKEKTEKVMIEDKDIDIRIKSTSDIKDIQLNKEDKSITFKVEGKDGSMGMTEIHVGSVLKGPYTVLLDGNPIEAIEVTNESGEQILRIIYMHSIHEIKVLGTEVVPEFPVAVLPILALITGIAIFVARSRSLNTI